MAKIYSFIILPQNIKPNYGHSIMLATESSSLTAAVSLIKKVKSKQIDKLYNEMLEKGTEHPINKFLQCGERPFGVGNPKDFYNTTKSNSGTIAVFPEYNKKVELA